MSRCVCASKRPCLCASERLAGRLAGQYAVCTSTRRPRPNTREGCCPCAGTAEARMATGKRSCVAMPDSAGSRQRCAAAYSKRVARARPSDDGAFGMQGARGGVAEHLCADVAPPRVRLITDARTACSCPRAGTSSFLNAEVVSQAQHAAAARLALGVMMGAPCR